MDTWPNVYSNVDAAEAVVFESKRMVETNMWLEPEELKNIPEESVVC